MNFLSEQRALKILRKIMDGTEQYFEMFCFELWNDEFY